MKAGDGFTFASGNELTMTINGEKPMNIMVGNGGITLFIICKSMTPDKPIKKVNITGATLTFGSGDAVVFTAQKSGDNAGAFDIANEGWYQRQAKQFQSLSRRKSIM